MKENETMGGKVLSNLFWRYAERCTAQIVQLIVSIILARIIAPDAFGTISIILVFTNILQVFVDSGIGNALIQKKDADDLDFSTVFYFNIIWCFALYMVLYAISPLIASFYEDESLTQITRILGIIIVISGVKNVQQAYIARSFEFKKFFWATIGGTLLSAVVGISMALNGYGVWALVAQKLVNIFVDTTVLCLTVKWRPKLQFSFARLKFLFGYAWKLLLASLMDFIYLDFQQLIIGKIYSPTVLAFYSRGKQFPNIIVANINTSIDSVLFPAMASEQDNEDNIRAMLKKSIKTSTYIMSPLMVGLFVVAPTLISVVLTDNWVDCIPFLRVFCITYLFQPIHTANMNALKAMARTDVLLKMEIIKKIFCVSILVSTMLISVEAMLAGLLACSLFTQIANAWPNRKLLHYGYIQQVKDIMPALVKAIAMGACIYPFFLLPISKSLCLILQIIVGCTIYIAISFISKDETCMYLLHVIKRMKSKEANSKTD